MKTTIAALTELLFIETPLEKADVIFVFGNDWLPTMEGVAQLWQQGYARHVLISGHSASKERVQSEAQRFMERGLELGLPREIFLLEHQATNTKENIVLSLPLLDGLLGQDKLKTILFVCKTFHTRRVYMTAKQYLPPNVRCLFFPTPDERKISKDGWWRDPVSKERVLAEVRRIAEYALKNDISID